MPHIEVLEDEDYVDVYVDEGEPLPRNFHAREVALAADNLRAGARPWDLLVSKGVRLEAIQQYRATLEPPWGQR